MRWRGRALGRIRKKFEAICRKHATFVIMADGSKAAFSLPSIIAVIAAIFSFTTGAFLGFVLAGIAIVAGIVGVILSLAPSVRGGVMSFVGIVAGLVGIIAAIIKTIGAIVS